MRVSCFYFMQRNNNLNLTSTKRHDPTHIPHIEIYPQHLSQPAMLSVLGETEVFDLLKLYNIVFSPFNCVTSDDLTEGRNGL